jgi:hypothetical protein
MSSGSYVTVPFSTDQANAAKEKFRNQPFVGETILEALEVPRFTALEVTASRGHPGLEQFVDRNRPAVVLAADPARRAGPDSALRAGAPTATSAAPRLPGVVPVRGNVRFPPCSTRGEHHRAHENEAHEPSTTTAHGASLHPKHHRSRSCFHPASGKCRVLSLAKVGEAGRNPTRDQRRRNGRAFRLFVDAACFEYGVLTGVVHFNGCPRPRASRAAEIDRRDCR